MAIYVLSEHLDAENNYNSAKINDKMQDSAIKVDLISRADLLNETVNKNSIWNTITDAKGRNLKEIIAELPTYSAEQTDLLNILIKEYLSKCECCDECFAEYFCIKNYLRESREPKDYCIENIKQYLSVRNTIYKVEQTYDWCHDCKEYDTEKHCCHRYSSFIRESLQDSINAVLEDIKAESEEKPGKLKYVGYSLHDSESRYQCPFCEEGYGSWDFINGSVRMMNGLFRCKCGKLLKKPE